MQLRTILTNSHKSNVINVCREIGEKADYISKELGMTTKELYSTFDFDPMKFYNELMVKKPKNIELQEHVELAKRAVYNAFDEMKNNIIENNNEYKNVSKKETKNSIWKPLAAITTGVMLALTGGVGASDSFDPQEAFAEEDKTVSYNSMDKKNESNTASLNFTAKTQIGADLVHESGNTGEGRKIVLLDSGYDYNHPELKSSYKGRGHNFITNSTDIMDDNGHGTSMAGIIAADGINPEAKGIAPDVEIIVGKVANYNGETYWGNIIDAIYWAVNGPDRIYGTEDDFNADAINLSLASSPYKYHCDKWFPAFTDAIKYARDKGVMVVIAAGNHGTDGVSTPGCISYAITVGSVDVNDHVVSSSGRGYPLDITAPSIDVLAPQLEGQYSAGSGTSEAVAVISATIALIKHAHPEYTPDQVEKALFNTAKDLGPPGKDSDYGWGRLYIPDAVNYKDKIKDE